MKIRLYGTPMCFRCTSAKMMLEKRRVTLEGQGTTIEYADVPITTEGNDELPQLFIDGKVYYGKDALLRIRELTGNTFAHPIDNNIKQ